jgi:hypothetical protein
MYSCLLQLHTAWSNLVAAEKIPRVLPAFAHTAHCNNLIPVLPQCWPSAAAIIMIMRSLHSSRMSAPASSGTSHNDSQMSTCACGGLSIAAVLEEALSVKQHAIL